MISDDERRDVAARLRDEAAHGEMHIRDFLGALCACIKTERNAYRALLLLADLIEPSEPKVRCVAEVKIDGERLEKLAYDAAVKLIGVDRDALLTLVKELETPCCGQLDPYLSDVARRIREALGVGR